MKVHSDVKTNKCVSIMGDHEIISKVDLFKETQKHTFSNLDEIIIKDFSAWKLEFNDTTYFLARDPKDYAILLTRVQYYEYELVYRNYFPCILLDDNNVTWDGRFVGHSFFPSIEYSDCEDCYIEEMNSKEYINVIVGIKLIDSYEDTKRYYILDNEEEMSELIGYKKTYLMKDGHGNTKIGRSYDPKLRESTLQAELPTITLLATCNNNIEHHLQNKYSSFRIRGEWFRLSDSHISDIVTEYKFKIVL